MEEEEKKVDQQEQQTAPPAEQPMSARDRYRSRYSEAHPDLNLDDEEAFYNQANQNLDELENFRESNRQLGEAMDKAPILAGLVLAAKEGQNPFAYLVENLGPDMDISDLAENPERAKQMGEALKKFQEKQEKATAKDAEIGENMAKSIQTLKEYQTEKGMGDEECVKMLSDFFGEYDDNGQPVGKSSFMQNAANGVVTKGMWEALFNARHYADDIASAETKAKASALNEHFQNEKKEFGPGLPPASSTNGRGRGERKPKTDDNSIEGFRKSLGL